MLQRFHLTEAKINKLRDQGKYQDLDLQGVIVKHTVTKKRPLKRPRCTVTIRERSGMEHVLVIDNFEAELRRSHESMLYPELLKNLEFKKSLDK